MGFEKFVKDTLDARNMRLKDPRMQAKLDVERRKTDESWKKAEQTLGEIGGNILKSVRKGRRRDDNLWAPVQRGTIAAASGTLSVIGRVLAASGRTAWYGIRRGIAK